MTCLNLVIVCEKTWEVNQSVRDQDEEENPNRKSFEDLEAVPVPWCRNRLIQQRIIGFMVISRLDSGLFRCGSA